MNHQKINYWTKKVDLHQIICDLVIFLEKLLQDCLDLASREQTKHWL